MDGAYGPTFLTEMFFSCRCVTSKSAAISTPLKLLNIYMFDSCLFSPLLSPHPRTISNLCYVPVLDILLFVYFFSLFVELDQISRPVF